MITYSEIKEVFGDIKNDKAMLYILRIFTGTVTLALIFSVIIFIHHAAKDKPAKLLFGLAEINTVKSDTVYKLIQSKKDTVTIYKESIKYIPLNTLTTTKIKSKKVDSIVKNESSVNGNNNHVVTGDGNLVGVNGDIVNGIKQRHINDAILSYILISIPNKDSKINFLLSGGKEGLNY